MGFDVDEVLGAFDEFGAALREDPLRAEVFSMLAFPAFVQMAFDARFSRRLAEILREDWDLFDEAGTPEGLAAAYPHLLCSLMKALAAESDVAMRQSR
jgi:hypothetical protein